MIAANQEGMIHELKADSPGSDNDMKVFKESKLYIALVDEGQEPFPGAKMLADQGYKTDLDCVVVCYSEEVVENNQRKAKVNKRVKTAKVVIEDDIGIWKNQFIPLKMGITAQCPCSFRPHHGPWCIAQFYSAQHKRN